MNRKRWLRSLVVLLLAVGRAPSAAAEDQRAKESPSKEKTAQEELTLTGLLRMTESIVKVGDQAFVAEGYELDVASKDRNEVQVFCLSAVGGDVFGRFRELKNKTVTVSGLLDNEAGKAGKRGLSVKTISEASGGVASKREPPATTIGTQGAEKSGEKPQGSPKGDLVATVTLRDGKKLEVRGLTVKERAGGGMHWIGPYYWRESAGIDYGIRKESVTIRRHIPFRDVSSIVFLDSRKVEVQLRTGGKVVVDGPKRAVSITDAKGGKEEYQGPEYTWSSGVERGGDTHTPDSLVGRVNIDGEVGDWEETLWERGRVQRIDFEYK